MKKNFSNKAITAFAGAAMSLMMGISFGGLSHTAFAADDVTPVAVDVEYKTESTINAEDVILTYGETDKKIVATTDSDGAITYETSSDVISVATDGTITAHKAGTAEVVITVAETNSFTMATTTVSVTVNRAQVTIKANDYVISMGDELPEYEYTVTGLVDGDTLACAPVITCAATNTNKAVTFDIEVALDITEDDRYTYIAENGKLVIKFKYMTGGGAGGAGGALGGGGSSGGRVHSAPVRMDPEINGKSASWTEIASEIEKMAYGSVITIKLNGNFDVPSYVIKAIADKDAKVTFVIDSVRQWYVDGANIEKPVDADLRIMHIPSIKTNKLRGKAGLKYGLDGANIPAELIITVDKAYAGKFANLFKMVDDKLVFVDNVRVGEDGRIVLDETAEGEYAIMLGEFSDRGGDVDNNGVTDAMDALGILQNAVELGSVVNPEVLDYNGDGVADAKDSAAILVDMKNGVI